MTRRQLLQIQDNVFREIKKQKDAFPIPDVELREAYKRAAKEVGMTRDKFAIRPENQDLVKKYLGSKWAHIPGPEIGDRIVACCKNPAKHGGDWALRGGHGAGKVPESPEWYREYCQTDTHYLIMKQKAWDFWEGKCCVCYKKGENTHHRTYERVPTKREWLAGKSGTEKLSDLVVLCRTCHKRHHKVMGIPDEGPNGSQSDLF